MSHAPSEAEQRTFVPVKVRIVDDISNEQETSFVGKKNANRQFTMIVDLEGTLESNLAGARDLAREHFDVDISHFDAQFHVATSYHALGHTDLTLLLDLDFLVDEVDESAAPGSGRSTLVILSSKSTAPTAAASSSPS